MKTKTKKKTLKTTINAAVPWGLRTEQGGDFVSTVLLDNLSAGFDDIIGMFNPAFDRSNGKKYESITLIGDKWGQPIRYATQAEAEKGHVALVKKTFNVSTSLP